MSHISEIGDFLGVLVGISNGISVELSPLITIIITPLSHHYPINHLCFTHWSELMSTPDFAKPWFMKIRGVLLQ